ncbi:MAG: hypothetical protein QXF30_05255 [Thermoplasmata archaeon]
MKKFLILILLFFILFFGCKKETNKDLAIEKCIELCEKAKKELNLVSQCLSDLYEWRIDDWVCDIASWPREEIDNLYENQCKNYREGKANHFVELNRDCKLIRAI